MTKLFGVVLLFLSLPLQANCEFSVVNHTADPISVFFEASRGNVYFESGSYSGSETACHPTNTKSGTMACVIAITESAVPTRLFFSHSHTCDIANNCEAGKVTFQDASGDTTTFPYANASSDDSDPCPFRCPNCRDAVQSFGKYKLTVSNHVFTVSD